MKRWQEFEKAIKDYLNAKRMRFIRIFYRCPKCGFVFNRQAKGWPDFFIYYPKIFAIEAKTGSSQLSKEQREIKEMLEIMQIEYIKLQDTVDELIKYFGD